MSTVETASATALTWPREYARLIAVTDLLVVITVVLGTQFVWFGFGHPRAAWMVESWIISGLVVLGWVATLAMYGSRDSRVIGSGTTEYKRIVDATLLLLATVAVVVFFAQLELSRGYFIVALPIGLLALLLSRWAWRKWLAWQRKRGHYISRVLLVGSRASVEAIAADLRRQPQAGYLVVGACTPGSEVAGYLPDSEIPVSTNLDQLHRAIDATGADTVVVTSSDELPPQRIRELSWTLEPGRQHLVVAPSLTDIGGPRIHMRPVAGLPLIHVETPRYEGFTRFAKRAFDVVSSAGLILVLSPVLLGIALIVRLSTPGPLLFRQERVGLHGKHFEMLKFRSMVVDAEAKLAELQAKERAEGNAVLFKMKDDPRVTPIGKVLRRYSLDELPQLFNVFGGSMSLVGPRPPLEREVAQYEHHVHRRFLVKPGITGLWQVSGRSNLSWEDTVRLDLYYVENWSITGDLVILWRTAKAVVARDGAY
ncbi:exopolysaccharide biosynthesis polyprenyl glycosylphosphotransferase [Microbacteriaceae bacterium SG_E_30_P1]|uniref:Exopolysaccharide biosynthesis polyprenyl glycosylphosphotransferase n=1 Tax=Antiquaquibacter oligotrophicus TaxID=2880260 RepID=A0ABT6KPH3_9MICO|nr:sugar transferase [Antiquaquibacter oligotrophicus]MDH6181880.1 exopolysaccharide biosynthesis polyprenyl glycosylphosphotransferase [Antiquaquibacter oligotrophicus]UDF12445.1 sugar transferase [Antiquaquibacter oligotrophicus]